MYEWTLSSGPRRLLIRLCDWPGAEPPIVILHGFLEQGAAWDRVARRLPRRVIAPDQRGHGRSGHVGGGGFYHFWDYVADVDALVQHLGAPVDLVGHSMGSTVAALFAGARPDAVRRLVLVEGLGPPDVTHAAIDRARRFLDDLRAPPSHSPLASVEAGIERVQLYNPSIPTEIARALVARTTRPSPGGLVWTWDPLHRARSPVPFQAPLFRRFLAEITAPTLVIKGRRSGFVVADEAQRLAALADARVAVVDDAGHLIHHDAPEALATLIEEHLS
ncbi:MAG TPA: alpha/beta hydrolase [Deltaproteobacteria bacterium]|nr:alpha/beta hydrolase [Deltaproteobacteria bacterium]